MIHRLIALAFHGAPPGGKYLVIHCDGRKDNNRPDNLRWAYSRTETETRDDAAEWRKPVGYEPLEVSADGRVRTAHKTSLRELVQRPTSQGYLRVTWTAGGTKRRCTVHRLVAVAFHGPQPHGKPCVLHSNGIKTDNRAENLRWGSVADNTADARKHGTLAYGERGGLTKLTEAQVRYAIDAMNRGVRRAVLARELGCRHEYLIALAHGVTWKHLDVPRVFLRESTRPALSRCSDV